VVAGFSGPPDTWAEIPKTIHYQGKLTEPDGTPVVGEHTVTMRLYDALTGGVKLWEEQHQLNFLPEDQGILSLDLGSRTPFEGLVSFTDPVFLSIEIDTGGEMVPRQPLTAVGYALNADRLDGLDAAQLLGNAGAAPLAENSVGASALSATAIQPGDIDAGDLPPHASRHQPGGVDALPTAGAVSVAATNSAGASPSLARADHAHEGLHSLAASGQPPIVGDALLAAGANITLSQSGQTITVASSGASGAGAPGNRVTASSSSPAAIGTASDTELLSATITKSQAGSALLALATVQLTHVSGPTKTVDVKLFRDAAQLDASYPARIGPGEAAVRDLPVSLHALDAPAAGTFTFTLRARASGSGARATTRRLTVLELP
jgi:hypothetical protein